MTVHDFLARLDRRFPKFEENHAARGDIEANLKKYPEQSLDRLWEAFLDEYDKGFAPRWASLYKLAREKGLRRNDVSGFSFWRCDKCNSAFSMEAAYCPKCKGRFSGRVVVGDKPQDYIESREDCGICNHFLATGSTESYGPFCPDFGTERHGKTKYCGSCLCYFCCRETLAVRKQLDGDASLMERLHAEDGFERDRLRREG